MGTTISKSISRRSARWLESRMEQMHEQMDADIARDIAEKKANAGPGGFTDPSARDAGFTRGFGPQVRSDIMQTYFLEQKAKETGREGLEMDPELVKFLQDMGPLERKIDEKYTSKMCSKCGHIDHKLGGKKIYSCIECGLKIQRDYGGSRGILIKGIERLQ